MKKLGKFNVEEKLIVDDKLHSSTTRKRVVYEKGGTLWVKCMGNFRPAQQISNKFTFEFRIRSLKRSNPFNSTTSNPLTQETS